MSILSLTDISYQVEQRQILNKVNLEVQAGDFLTLTGPSGGGKSTLLKIIASLISPSEGEIIFEGQTPTTLTLRTAGKSGYFNPEKYTVVASKDGYKTQTTVIDWHVSGWYYVGNLALGGIIGYLIVDPISGDMYYLDEEVNLNMSPIKN